MKKRWCAAIALLLLVTACGSPPKPTRSSASTERDRATSSDTVYDDNASRGADYESEYIDDEPTLREDTLGVTDLDSIDGAPDAMSLSWEPVYFAFDEAGLTEEARRMLADYARTLRENPRLEVLLEGHCDSRGTEEYNLALGERRVQSVRTYLVQLGVPRNRLKTISYGELRPRDPRENEEAWALNRRVDFTFPPGARN